MHKAVRSYLAEFLGTFTLVFIGTAAAVIQGIPEMGDGGILRISFAFGFTLMVLVWVIGPVSGCHLNPAVTIPMALSRRLPLVHVPGYVVAQVAGGLAASGLLCALVKAIPGYEFGVHGLGANANALKQPVWALFVWELVMTSLFLYTIFTATRPNTPQTLTGLAIGGFLFVAHLVGAPLGDASLNPARSFGPAILQGGDAFRDLWVFLAAPVAGGLIGFGLYWVLHDEPAQP